MNASLSLQSCDKIETTQEFATNLCRNYQKKVRGLSGNGMQIAPSTIDPDRGCKVACQDEFLSHRFYLVNGEHGFFPFGTKCSRTATDKRYCVNGKCLQFDKRNIPLVESHISLALYRSRRSIQSTDIDDTELSMFHLMNSTHSPGQWSAYGFDRMNPIQLA